MDSILLLKKQTGFTGSFWIHPVYPVNPGAPGQAWSIL
jgi:hypothetical protein